MELYLTNTETQKKELFSPQNPPRVTMYQCGPTLYWDQHIGNLRSVVLADFIVRTLRAHAYNVIFVRNYTDVGHLTGDNEGDADRGTDRMEKAAEREHISPEAIAKKYREQYEKDILALNVITPTHTPSATQYIQAMQEMIAALVAEGYAYTTSLAVYFDISRAQDYYRLSKQKAEALFENSGHGAVSDLDKKNPQDFALWFFKAGTHAQALQTWKSPFISPLISDGEGFPGWHIECSAMSKTLLGDTIDIHMGGIEHIPIHHTNEIAQSEAANHTDYVRYWLHNEHLLVDGGKMSKSSGTSYLLKDIIAQGFSALDLRYFFTQAHYRSKQNFTWEALKASQTAYRRLREAVSALPDGGMVDATLYEEFLHAVSDDINTSQALATVHNIMKSDISDADKKATTGACDTILGLDITLPFSFEIPEEVNGLAQKRIVARNEKNWTEADRLRDEIQKKGFDIKDSVDSYQIFPL